MSSKRKLTGSIATPDHACQKEMDQALLEEGNRYLKLLPSSVYKAFPHEQLVIWCNRHQRYGIVTTELVDWLREQIGDRSVIEIAAGKGDLSHHLNIHPTDGYSQTTEYVKDCYESCGHIPLIPNPEVERLEAVQAIKKYKPKVVIASWLTQRYLSDPRTNYYYGVDETQVRILSMKYIHIGNTNVHGGKTVLRKPHKKYVFPWLVSRAANQSQNAIWVFSKI